jgi:hypothetical protein
LLASGLLYDQKKEVEQGVYSTEREREIGRKYGRRVDEREKSLEK